MDSGGYSSIKLGLAGTLAGIATFVVVFIGFIQFAPVGGPTITTILWTSGMSGVVVGSIVAGYLSSFDRTRVAVGLGLVGVLLILAPLWFPVIENTGPGNGQSYSGKVASDETMSLSFSDPPPSKTHVLELEAGDRLRIDIDEPSGATWELQLPDGQTLSSGVGPSVGVETTDGAAYYTANQTGSHRIRILVRPYSRASYEVSVEQSTE